LKDLNYYDLIIGIDDGIIIDDELSVNVKEHLYDIMVSDKVEIGKIIYITRAYSIIDKNGKNKNVFNKIPYRVNRKVKNIANQGYQLNSVLSMLDDRFIRTHRSCYINKNRLEYMDLTNNIIKFDNNTSIEHLSRRFKKNYNTFQAKK